MTPQEFIDKYNQQWVYYNGPMIVNQVYFVHSVDLSEDETHPVKMWLKSYGDVVNPDLSASYFMGAFHINRNFGAFITPAYLDEWASHLTIISKPGDVNV